MSALSRRALVAVAALVATAPSAAGKKKPLAFVAATVRSFELNANATGFDVSIAMEFVHPDSGVNGAQELGIGIALAPSTEAVYDETRRFVQDFDRCQ